MAGADDVLRRIRRWIFLHPNQIRRLRTSTVFLAALAAISWSSMQLVFRKGQTTRLNQTRITASDGAPIPPSWSASVDALSAAPRSFAERAVAARDEGRYDEALALIDEGLASKETEPELLVLKGELKEDLRLKFDFYYLRDRGLPVTRGENSSQIALGPGDAYYLVLSTSAPSYLYVVQIDTGGRLLLFCPNADYVPNSNPVPAGDYRIPDGSGYLRVPPGPGVERLYVLAARWRQSALEQLLDRISSQAAPEDRRPLIDALTSRLELEQRATNKLPGLSFGTYQFRNLGGVDAGK